MPHPEWVEPMLFQVRHIAGVYRTKLDKGYIVRLLFVNCDVPVLESLDEVRAKMLEASRG